VTITKGKKKVQKWDFGGSQKGSLARESYIFFKTIG